MRMIVRAFCAVLLMGGCATVQDRPIDLLIRNVAVLDPESGRLSPGLNVAVEAGRIVAVSPHAGGWNAERTIEGEDGVLMPGFVDAHAHLREAGEEALISYLAAGITTFRDMNGRPHLLRWRDEVEAGTRIGPRLIVASPTVANISSPRQGFATPETVEAGRQLVDRFIDEGYDFIKIYSFLPKEGFEGIMERARERNVRVAGHAPLSIPYEDLLDTGVWSIEHLTGLAEAVATDASAALDAEDNRGVFQGIEVNPDRLDRISELIAERGVWQVPTMVYWENVPPPPTARSAWEDPEIRALAHRSRLQIVRSLYEAGAPLAVGSDSDAGEHLSPSAYWDELELMVEAGIPAPAVLKAATAEGARMMGLDDVGAIGAGAVADLVLLRCNPAQNISCIRHPRAVISRGRPLSETDQ